MTYQEEIDTKILEVVNDSGFSRARESGLSDENKSGWPALTLASTMNFPMYPVPPMNRILLLSAIA
jgi:hypothetical protein